MTTEAQANTALLAALIAHMEATGRLARGDSEEIVRMAKALCNVTDHAEAARFLERGTGPLIQGLIDAHRTDDPPGARARIKAVK